MITAAALIAIALTVVGGTTMSAALSAPIVALLSVHSLAAAGGIIEGLSVIQKLEAAHLALVITGKAVRAGKHLAPLQRAIIIRLQADARLPHGDVVARHVGGPLGWGRAPVEFVYETEGVKP